MPRTGLSSGCSTAATKSETRLSTVFGCCGTEGAGTADVNVVVAEVIRAWAEERAKDCGAGGSATAATLTVCRAGSTSSVAVTVESTPVVASRAERCTLPDRLATC